MNALRVLFLFLAAAPGGAAQLDFQESYLSWEVKEFDCHVVDQDQDGRQDLIVSLLDEDRRRRLELRRQRADQSFPVEADWSMTIPPDAVCFSVVDVREDPGREIVLHTGRAIFSVSPTESSLRGNLRKERSMELFPNLAEDGPLSRWELVKDVDGGEQEELLVVSEGQLVLLRPSFSAEEDAETLPEIRRISCREAQASRPSVATFFAGGSGDDRDEEEVQLRPPFFLSSPSSMSAFPAQQWLDNQASWEVPFLEDWDGDGRLDPVFFGSEGFEVTGAEGESRTFSLPEALEDPDEWQPRLLDFDGDGRVEVIAIRDDDEEHVFLLFDRLADGNLKERPVARVKLSSLGAEFEERDVDGDGILDLVARQFDIPSGLTQASNVRMDLTLQVYRGQAGGTLERRPKWKFERSFDPDQMGDSGDDQIMDLSGDFDGDGLMDLLVLEPGGALEITALRNRSDRWELEDEPLVRYQPTSRIEDASVEVLNADSVADLILKHESALTIFVSRPGNQR